MASMQLFDPFESLDETFRTFWRPVRFEMSAAAPSMKLEVSENDGAYHVKAQIPGVKKEDIKVYVEGNVVSISAEAKQEKEEKKGEKVVYSERAYGMASRSFTLPAPVDAQAARAEYKDGVLTLTLPKKAGASAKRIAIG